jgi:hypothetical protein
MAVIQVHGIGPFRVDRVDSVFVQTASGSVARFRNASRSAVPSSQRTSAIVWGTPWP